MPSVIHDFAILAPVPLEHLESGLPIAQTTGFVAFGTRKWEFLQAVDTRREGLPIPALIYASDEGVPAKDTFVISWFGWYNGHAQATSRGSHPDGKLHRPPSTEQYPGDSQGHWAAFWHVSGLRELPADKRLPIGRIATVKGGWRKNAPPRGPELVAVPELLADET